VVRYSRIESMTVSSYFSYSVIFQLRISWSGDKLLVCLLDVYSMRYRRLKEGKNVEHTVIGSERGR